MGDIGIERREVEFEPVPAATPAPAPVPEPAPQPAEPATSLRDRPGLERHRDRHALGRSR